MINQSGYGCYGGFIAFELDRTEPIQTSRVLLFLAMRFEILNVVTSRLKAFSENKQSRTNKAAFIVPL